MRNLREAGGGGVSAAAGAAAQRVADLQGAIERVIKGKSEAVRLATVTLLAGGHLLVEDVPGVGKTTLAQALALAIDCNFQRIQFTSDLLPSDVIGLSVYDERKGTFDFKHGPIFANIVLADEINRTPPKTQAALLEAMQEGRVTVQGVSYELPRPFHVLATQNPIEMEGTYPLPEAQLDRFMFQIKIGYLPEEDEVAVVKQTTAPQDYEFERQMSADEIIAFQRLVRQVPVSDTVARYAVRLVGASRPGSESAPDFVNR